MDILWLTVKDTSVDIKINAQGSYVEVIGSEDDLEVTAGIVFDLWAATVADEKGNKLTAGSGSYLERSGSRIGFADMRSGERLPVK
jgi:hypothetical protein